MNVRARPVPEGFEPYVWASSADEVAARRGLRPEQVIRYDANVPALPGVPRIPIGESFARVNEYPEGTYRELREAAAAYTGVEPDWIVPDAGADGVIALVAQTFLGPGRRAAIQVPTYPLYAIASGIEGAEVVPFDEEDVAVVWLCNPNNPTGELIKPEEVAGLARARPNAVFAVDEAYFEYCGKSVVPLIGDVPNLVAIRTVSKAFGFAALRVGYAVAVPEVARELEARREPGPIGTLAMKIASAALLDPRFDVEETVAERERMRSSLLAAGYDVPEGNANFVLIRLAEATALADRLEEQGLVVRRYPQAIRITVRIPAENDLILEALGVSPHRSAARSALVVKTTAETALRVSLSLDGQSRSRIDTGIGFLDHLLAQLAFHGGLDLELLAGGDLAVDEHHTVEDVLSALGDVLGQALGSRDGLARYGAATVPMDEARATAAVDLVRRPHAEVSLAFMGERVGGLAPTLLPHALERFAQQAVLTLHVEGSGEDDHHLAEAAFKALGRALREAIAPGAAGIRSTKGSL